LIAQCDFLQTLPGQSRAQHRRPRDRIFRRSVKPKRLVPFPDSNLNGEFLIRDIHARYRSFTRKFGRSLGAPSDLANSRYAFGKGLDVSSIGHGLERSALFTPQRWAKSVEEGEDPCEYHER
jgi:hypothetical protein